MRYDEYSETIVNGRVTHPNNPYRFANFADGEPNDAGPYEDKLQMTGNSVGGRLWNDLRDLNTITGYYASARLRTTSVVTIRSSVAVKVRMGLLQS